MNWDKNLAKPQAILFCCTMNAIRSPMAEGLLKKICGTSVYVDSAGVIESPLDNFMVESMAKIGIDMSNHRGKNFEALQDFSYDLIIALSPKAAEHAKTIVRTRTMACEIFFWEISDPSTIEGSRENKIAAYSDVCKQISAKIEHLIEACGLARVQ